MLVKCLKHVIRTIMRDSSSIYITNGISHAFNCVFGPQYLQNLLNEGSIECDINSQQIQPQDNQ